MRKFYSDSHYNNLLPSKLHSIKVKETRGKRYDHPFECLWGELPDDFVPIEDFHIEKVEERDNISRFESIFYGDFEQQHIYKPLRKIKK